MWFIISTKYITFLINLKKQFSLIYGTEGVFLLTIKYVA
jgi:hypothetical protein